jgi:hypothetical protein
MMKSVPSNCKTTPLANNGSTGVLATREILQNQRSRPKFHAGLMPRPSENHQRRPWFRRKMGRERCLDLTGQVTRSPVDPQL